MNKRTQSQPATVTFGQVSNGDIYEQIVKRAESEGIKRERLNRELSFAVSIANQSYQLKQADRASILQAVFQLLQIGLTLNPAAKEAYLIPRFDRNSQTIRAGIEPSYIGLVKLLTDAGSVERITSKVVYQNDAFDVTEGTSLQVVHKPYYTQGAAEPGEPLGAYAIATMKSGLQQFEFISLADLHAIRERSDGYQAYLKDNSKKSVWITDAGEMYRKAVIKRIYKHLPRTKSLERADKAIQVDNEDFRLSWQQMSQIETLAFNSTLSGDEIQETVHSAQFMNRTEADQLIARLKLNQLSSEEMGVSNQTTNVKSVGERMARDEFQERPKAKKG